MKKSSGEGTRVREPPVPTLRSLIKILHGKLKYRQRSRLSPRAFTKVQKLCLVSADGNAHPSRSSRGGRNPGQSALSTRLWTLLQEFHFVVSWQRWWTKPRGVPRLPVPGRLRLTEPKARRKGSDAGRVWVAGLRRWGQKCSGVEGMDALLHPTPGRCNLVTCISYLSTHFFFLWVVKLKTVNDIFFLFPNLASLCQDLVLQLSLRICPIMNPREELQWQTWAHGFLHGIWSWLFWNDRSSPRLFLNDPSMSWSGILFIV